MNNNMIMNNIIYTEKSNKQYKEIALIPVIIENFFPCLIFNIFSREILQ